MKILTGISAVLLLAIQVGEYWGCYDMGWLGAWWVYFDPILVFPAEMLLLCLLGVGAAYAIGVRRNRLWTAGMLLAGVIIFFGPWFIAPPGALTVYGIRDHVMKVTTVDGLRSFARDYSQQLPNVELDHGRNIFLNDKAPTFEHLAAIYPFLKWGLGKNDGPSLRQGDGQIEINWGGPFGHWGFSVSIDGSKNDAPEDPDSRILRVSDDIYFFDGD